MKSEFFVFQASIKPEEGRRKGTGHKNTEIPAVCVCLCVYFCLTCKMNHIRMILRMGETSEGSVSDLELYILLSTRLCTEEITIMHRVMQK